MPDPRNHMSMLLVLMLVIVLDEFLFNYEHNTSAMRITFPLFDTRHRHR
jgi:hypothetical protein